MFSPLMISQNIVWIFKYLNKGNWKMKCQNDKTRTRKQVKMSFKQTVG